MTSVRSTSLTEARIVVVRSRTIVVSIPLGIEALREGSSLRDPVHRLDDVGARLAKDDDQ